MAIVVRDETNTARTVTEIIVRDGTNTPRTLSEIRVRDASNVSRVVFSTGGSGLSVSLDKTLVTGSSFGTGTAVTGSVVATPSGGTAPYTYVWSLLTYSSGTMPTADFPASASTTFTQTALGPGSTEEAVFEVQVTDSAAASVIESVQAVWSDLT